MCRLYQVHSEVLGPVLRERLALVVTHLLRDTKKNQQHKLSNYTYLRCGEILESSSCKVREDNFKNWSGRACMKFYQEMIGIV